MNIGYLKNNDGESSKYITIKTNTRFFKHSRVYSLSSCVYFYVVQTTSLKKILRRGRAGTAKCNRGGGGGTPYERGGDARRLLNRGVNFRFWSRLGCSGQNTIIFNP